MHLFADTCEAVAATRSRLAKAAILQEYFARLDDAELALAARFLAGRAFPLSDQRVLNVGFANVRDALRELVPAADEVFGELSVRLGDMGDVAFAILSRRAAPPPTLTLHDVAALFDRLAETSGARERVKLLVAALERATPVEARYLVKIMMGELRIGLQEGQVEDGIARAYSIPVADVQWANMLIGDLGEAAVLGRHGRLHEARMRLFHPLKFMLASPVENPSEVARLIAGQFFVEDKFDGVRMQVHRAGARLAMYSRTLDEVAHRFPELHAALLELPGEFILDGEVVGMRDGRAIPFTEFQVRLGRKTVTPEMVAATPVVFVAFDLLYRDGETLLLAPLSARREQLANLLAAPGPGLRLADSFVTADTETLEAAFAAARERGNEGLMVKHPASTYKPGRRGKEWLKVKRPLATLDVVVTGVEWGHGKRREVLSDYTFAVRGEDGMLLEVGKAYSGLTDAEIAELTEWFKAHTLRDFGRFRLVEPHVVLEVAFDNVQPSARHASGFALRFPRIVRIRTDKLPTDIDSLETVRSMAQGSA